MQSEELQRCIQGIAAALYPNIGTAPSIRFVRNQLGSKALTGVYLSEKGVEVLVRVKVPRELIDDLRNLAAESGRGTWFRASVEVRADGTFSADFDYEVQPNLKELPILEEDVLDELEFWPRSTANCPPWLREKMSEFGIENSHQ